MSDQVDHAEPVITAPRATPRKPLPLLVFAVGVLAGVVVTAGSVLAYQAYGDNRDEAKPLFVTGTMTLLGSSSWNTTSSGDCTGAGGYNDMHEGTAVTIANASGTTIAVTSLGAGVRDGNDCAFNWAVVDVPPSEAFYKLTIGHRGDLTYPREKLSHPLTTSLG